MKARVTTLLVTSLILLSLLFGSCESQDLLPGQIVEVKRGDLNITISSDGNLKMPNEFDLKFGTQGQVDEILVEEGDNVKQGALLALLENSAQRNAVRTALLSIQTARNNITFGCDTDHLPYSYPNLSVSRIADEALKDIDKAVSHFKEGNYKDASYWLVMAYFDIQVCEDLIKSRPDAAVLAGAKTNSTYHPDLDAGSLVDVSANDALVVDYLQKYRQKLIDITVDMKAGAYEKLASELYAAQQEMMTVNTMAKSTIRERERFVFRYADTPTSVDFLQSSLRSLQELEKYLSQSDAIPVEAAKQLYIAKLSLLVGRDVLENQTLIFESGGGINWKTLQQYNLSVQNAEIALYKAKQDIMKTAIIAPSDGSVVSVDLKKSYVLSAQDYSSRTAVKLVDTDYVEFQGLVDEIDIMKVKPGQKATITIDALSNKIFTGTVKFISPYGTKSGNVIKFAITIEMDPRDVQLRGGLSATAEIVAASVKNALLVPVSLITYTPRGPMVTVVNEQTGKPERRPLTLGVQTFQYAEVLSGLKEGEKVQMTSEGGMVSPVSSPTGPGRDNPMRNLR